MDAEKLIMSTDILTMHAERLNGYKEINIVYIKIKKVKNKAKNSYR
jgi:hypothetical protein